jgi:hypothetical protein
MRADVVGEGAELDVEDFFHFLWVGAVRVV